ncbi:hypothetical protein [Bradyrhizobium sp. AUGA SZCCT0182]|uniref:hypothetical protein n=1 Tax=Bradyrhizobium sp. AUGA SZCCT0182 TaxID=2807667 RepID=UPI001BAACB93|nr:hypothetical protein [Bradyrhizobium sp. AUGA SZCCT0182]MBR1235620.1 hypothetical protein [Bradyrhizobium sp. AUGA SZCCT0182]
MANFRYKVLRESLYVQQYFKGVALEWRELPTRFFKTLYELLGERLNIQTAELSANPSTQLSEVRARYNIYGGPSTVTLFADRLAFEFPNFTASELTLVYEIMGTIHDRFPAAFPELALGRVEVQDMSHLDLGSQESVSEFFEPFEIPALASTFSDLPAQFVCAPIFYANSDDGQWKCKVEVEPSNLTSTAIFGAINATMLKPDPSTSYLEKAAFIQQLTQRCLKALDLEIDVAPQQ